MRHLKNYKIFESNSNLRESLLDINDIIIDLEDQEFVKSKSILFEYNWIDYKIKGDRVLSNEQNLLAWAPYQPGEDLSDKEYRGITILFKSNKDNYDDIRSVFKRLVNYTDNNLKEFTKKSLGYIYSNLQNQFENMKTISLNKNWKNQKVDIDEVFDELIIKSTQVPTQVPSYIKFNIYKNESRDTGPK
jgi:hypothetical protein